MYDVVIIGAGMSGLAAGIRLAMYDQPSSTPPQQNAIRPIDNYSNSDFDIRHMINANAIYQLPIGKGRRFGGGCVLVG